MLRPVRLYNSQLSGNCWKVRQILAHRGIEYERVEVDVIDRSNRRDVLGGKNPALRVPTLELDDGQHLAESNAILWYLADGTEYVPTDALARARVLQWMFFEQYELEPSIAVARFWISILGQRDRYAAELESKWRAGNRVLAALDEHLSGCDWLVGDEYSIADISLYAYTHVADEGDFDLEPYGALRGWLDRVAAVPGHLPIAA
ncbi:MAG TPA: glutathione S-transferase family protein [Gaiellaceae bacterium]|nr:glutathione S-transferase family protein [Gaiellaceae bacterium]